MCVVADYTGGLTMYRKKPNYRFGIFIFALAAVVTVIFFILRSSTTPAEEMKETVENTTEPVVKETITFYTEPALVEEDPVSHPSNTTRYDTSLTSYFDEMHWPFFDESFAIMMAVEDPSATEITIVNTIYGTLPIASMEAGTAYFIEQWKDEKWEDVPYSGSTYPESSPVSVYSGETDEVHVVKYAINWSDSYGTLEPGYYRIGRYYTATDPYGETDTQICYAKFRVYDEKTEELLIRTHKAVEDIKARENYHLIVTDWKIEDKDRNRDGITDEGADYYRMDLWKQGENYLQERKFYLYDSDAVSGHRGELIYNGVGYGLTWGGEDYNGLCEAKEKPNLKPISFQTWANSLSINTANIIDVIENGNAITVSERSSFYEDVPEVEWTYTFDSTGNLTKIVFAFVKDDGTRVAGNETCISGDDVDEMLMIIDDLALQN